MSLPAVVGLLVMGVSEALTLAHIEPFYSWNTPIVWTGFLIFADSVVWRARGRSWLRTSPREFAFLAIVSVPLWLVFEFFNRFIDNWYYVGLPETRTARYLGYAWSFSTIWPAIFEGADLVGLRRAVAKSGGQEPSDAAGRSQLRFPAWVAAAVCAAGALMLAWPLLWPSRYLAAPVWLGFIFLLDPLNERLGAESISGDLRRRTLVRLGNLVASGFLCGVLWEFWNYWARAKWHYTVPIMERVKIFEMPLPGYFGFPVFALECFTMYAFVRVLIVRLFPRMERWLGHPIALP